MWKEYQEQAASLFRSMGFDATVEAAVEGARGAHKIDVWVVGSIHAIKFKWVVECKDWKVNVPKEKVLALLAIVQDVGADRGFLLSEVGFQAGAIRVAHSTNITLTSIADLGDDIRDSVLEVTAARLHWRLSKVNDRLWHLYNEHVYVGEVMQLIYNIRLLDLRFKWALRGKFPVSLFYNKQWFAAVDWNDFVKHANALLNSAEACADEGESKSTERA